MVRPRAALRSTCRMGAKGDVHMCPSLRLEQVQQIQLTPEVRTGVQIMAMPVLDLRTFIADRVMENPFLCMEDPLGEPALPAEEFESLAARTPDEGTSLEVELLTQLMMELRTPLDHSIAQMLMRGIDERGYLRLDTDIAADVLGTDPNHVEWVLKKMQTECTPAGIGARSLQECLVAQLVAAGDDDALTRTIVESHLPQIAEGRIQQVAAVLGVSAAQVQRSLDKIRRLDPHPAARFERDGSMALPEVVVIQDEGGWTIKVRKGLLPKVMIDRGYADALDDPTISKRAVAKMRELLREAEGFIKAIDLRKAAVISITSAVVEHQRRFFDEGTSGLRPLAMADVAQMTGLSEATVSRVANSITLATPQGVLSLRYFFHSGVGGTLLQEDASSLAVKQAIKELVDAEDKQHPLSDAKLVALLAERGMAVSRRTVNKYRTALGILSTSKRKVYR